MEHVLHVSTIATTICKGLGLDVELAQAIALGHDLGHAPFGHVGEKAIHALSEDSGGFIHEIHSLRVVDKIARDGQGLNLTYAVRDGIASHCGEEFQQALSPDPEPKDLDTLSERPKAPSSYEGCVVRIADKIAYLGRDIEDAIVAGLITAGDVPENLKKSLGTTNGEIIDTLVMDVVQASEGEESILLSDEKFELICQLKEFNYRNIYNHPLLLENDRAISNLLKQLFAHLVASYYTNVNDFKAYARSRFKVTRHFGLFLSKRTRLYEKDTYRERPIIDFTAGMTDSYALEAANDILYPKSIDSV